MITCTPVGGPEAEQSLPARSLPQADEGGYPLAYGGKEYERNAERMNW